MRKQNIHPPVEVEQEKETTATVGDTPPSTPSDRDPQRSKPYRYKDHTTLVNFTFCGLRLWLQKTRKLYSLSLSQSSH